MPWVIGVDEAGYGPNLGPLVVAATLWHVDSVASELREVEAKAKSKTRQTRRSRRDSGMGEAGLDLYARLAPLVAPPPASALLSVADSKRLYSPQRGLEPLERIAQVTACLLRFEKTTEHWFTLAQALTANNGLPDLASWPWYAASQQQATLGTPEKSAGRESIEPLAQAIREQGEQTGLRFVSAAVAIVEPRVFNEACETYDNKSTVLSTVTLKLVRQLVQHAQAQAPDDAILCRCDRHGGRARYRGLLETAFPETWFEPLEETALLSRYQGTSSPPANSLLAIDPTLHQPGPAFGPMEFRFEVDSEQFLETAWASCLAKFFREQTMDAVNDFWCQKVPGLVPTRGYPGDAMRFRESILPVAQELGLPESLFWRSR